LDVQIDDASGTGSLHVETMVRTIDAGLAKPERVDEEGFLIAHVANRQHSPKEAARSHVSRDLGRRPRRSFVRALLDHLEEESSRMPYSEVLRAKPFLHTTVFGAMPVEVLFPERDRADRNGVTGARQLAGPCASRLSRVRKAGGNRTHVGIAISVVEVIDGHA